MFAHDNGNPVVKFKWAESDTRVLDTTNMFLCGRLRIRNRNSKKNCPANRFDLNGTASQDSASYEQVAYMSDRIGVHSFIRTLRVSDLHNSTYEEVDGYNRNVSSTIGAVNSYSQMCSVTNMNLSSMANNDVCARTVCGDVEFAIPLESGFFNSNPRVSLARGLEIAINLDSNSQVLFGKDASEGFIYEIHNCFIHGDYLIPQKPIKEDKLSYISYHSFDKAIYSSNDSNNVNMTLAMVNTVYHNFLASDWTNNYGVDAFSTPPPLQYNDGDEDYEEAEINRYNLQRGGLRFPNNYPMDLNDVNKKGAFQALRSRQYLGAIIPYGMHTDCLLSPDSEGRFDMVPERTDFLNTPQTTDQAMVKAWTKNATSGAWSRTGKYEKGAQIYGIGLLLDPLANRAYVSYQDANYNFQIESTLNNTQNETFIFARAGTVLTSYNGGKQLVAQN